MSAPEKMGALEWLLALSLFGGMVSFAGILVCAAYREPMGTSVSAGLLMVFVAIIAGVTRCPANRRERKLP